MKYVLSVCLFVLLAFKSISQEKHFIFIQSDNKQLFNVSLNGKLYSANSSGYLIIPKLFDGEYNLVFGFPDNTFPDQQFKCIINKKDAGFGLKNFGEKGWGLFNLQSLDVTMAGGIAAAKVAAIPQTKREDEPISFNKKSNDAKEPPADTLIENAVVENKKIVSPPADTMITVLPLITKLAEDKNKEGVTLSYTDDNGANTDTIQLTIPSSKASKHAVNEELKPSSPDSATEAKIALLNQRNDDVKFLEIDMDAAKTDSIQQVAVTNEPAKTSPSGNVPAPVSAPNSIAPVSAAAIAPPANVPAADSATTIAAISKSVAPEPIIVKPSAGFCNDVASEEDYMKLRRKMALQNSDDKMIREAKKVYKDKCFTTHQVKGLSTLFLNDEGRYHFFTASYSFVSDPAAYSSLQSEFIDPFYINRFKSITQ